MAECVRTPTRTTNVPSVTNTVFTTTRTSESSLPTEFVTTSFWTDICTFNSSLNEDICDEVRTTVVQTIPGETTIVFVTEITTLPVTTMVPATLYGTSCPPNVTPTPDPETPTPDPIPDPPSSTPSTPIITGPSSFSRPTSGITSRSSSALPSGSTLPQETETSTNVAPIVGGAVGGAVGLLALGVMAWFFFKKATFGKNSKFDDMFDKADDLEHVHHEKPLMNLGLQGGQQVIQNMQNQPPANNNGANNAQQNQGQPTGYQGQGQEGYQNVYQQQGDPTGAMEQTMNGGEYQPQGNEQEGPELDDIKRKHLRRLFNAMDDEQGQAPHPQMPQHNMPPPRPLSNGGIPPVAPFVVNQVYPPQQPQFSNPPVNGYHPHQAQQGYYGPPPSTLSHNPSVTSSGYYASQYGSPPQPVGGLPPAQGHGHTPSLSASSYGRTGSPVPVQNNQVLQVVNPETSYQHNQGASGSSAGYAVGSSSATPAYPTDGKGRPVNMGGEKAPIVHLDGGRYEEPGPSTSGTTHPPSGPPPPMYTS